ncbi:MAG: GNAT family N-acetyltransferase, partial [Gammaproteobacteria bacterium]|nr:GNAT family N-acetyltransferase [Gammaproteobacteria bacterium]
MDFKWHSFCELKLAQLYACLALRSSVFVVEQNCAFLDLDGRDFKALHLLGEESGVIVAYLRFFPPSENEKMVSFGR